MKRSIHFLILLSVSVAIVAPAAQPDPAKAPRQNVAGAVQKIDALLAANWQKEKLTANPPATDDVIVRRLYLDIAGRIPTYRESEEFLKDKSKDKRARLIDKLLASEGYVQHMFSYWADILRAQTVSGGGGPGGAAYTKWIKDSLRENKPYDQMVREMVTSQGKVWDNAAIGYYLRDRGMPLDNMAATVRVFLGTRIECAQCHNHPFDKWSQMQFYQMAAYTYGISSGDYNGGGGVGEARKMVAQKVKEKELTKSDSNGFQEAFRSLSDPLRYTSLNDANRKLQLPHDYQYPNAKPKEMVQAAVMYGTSADCAPGARNAETYANWMTSKDNTRFVNLIANRLWKKAFGVGLFEPVDEIMDNTVASNPALMTYLEGLMRDLNFDMKAYLRVLYNTTAYQRSVTKEETFPGVPYHFTGPLLRRMSAEQMWDSFVTLMNPTPDMPNFAALDAQTKRITGVKKLADALGLLSGEEVYEGALVAATAYNKGNAHMQEVQKEITAARADNDLAKVKELTKSIGGYQNEARKLMNDLVITKGIKRLESQEVALKTDGKVAAASENAPLSESGEMAMQMAMNPYGKSSAMTVELREDQKKQMNEEAVYFGITDPKQVKLYLKSREETMRRWLRAAEIESPAPRGHYLREFGQSDRETIENSNNEASVPQALVLMNSELLPQILNPFSALTLSLNKMTYPDEKLEAAYVTLLSRKPTAAEKEAWQKAQDKGVGEIEDLIFALMNTQQFIFIQ